jgi:hypothetical protein
MINSTQSEFEDEVPSDGLDNNVTFALRNLLPLNQILSFNYGV